MKNPNMKIKVCGMRDEANIDALIKLNPDFIGFILYPGSKRYVGDNYDLKYEIPKNILRVGVFVNALIPDIISWINRLQLDFVQLHGNESPECCAELFNMDVKIMKAFGIDNEFDFSILETYQEYCEFFLFDTKTELHGGSGKQFDWNMLSQYSLNLPFFLSGGIGPDDVDTLNYYQAIFNIYGIDINSQFEIQPGLNNTVSLKSFMNKIRSYN